MCEIESSKHEARNGPLLGYEIVAQIQKVDPDENKKRPMKEGYTHTSSMKDRKSTKTFWAQIELLVSNHMTFRC